MLAHKEKQLSELIDAFLTGNEGAFEQMAVLIHQDILNIAYRYLGNLEDAKDVLQEVLLKVYRKLEFFKQTAKFSTWIYRVTVNTTIDFIRRKKRALNLKSRYKKEASESGSLKDVVNGRDKMRILNKACQALPLRQKNVFILKHYQGLTIEEISRVLGCSPSTVKTHLVRAIEALKNNIGGLP